MQPQKGFIGLPILIAIVIGLIVVGGGAYYFTHRVSSPQVSFYQQATTTPDTVKSTGDASSATIDQNSLTTTSANPTITGTKTYTNSQYGFSFQYPSNLSMTSPGKVYGEYSFHGFATQSVASVVSGPKSFSVYVSSNPNDVSNCLSVLADHTLPGYEGGNLAKMTTINGAQFAVFNGFENAAMGRSENGTVYNTVKNNACYSIDVKSITNRNDTQAYINSGSIIDPIIQSFRFN